jgi:hypothetical protein
MITLLIPKPIKQFIYKLIGHFNIIYIQSPTMKQLNADKFFQHFIAPGVVVPIPLPQLMPLKY